MLHLFETLNPAFLPQLKQWVSCLNLYEEDGTVSMIDLANRKLLGKVKTPRTLAGIAMSADGRIVVAVDDKQPTLFLVDTASESVVRTVRLEGVAGAAQIARYSPDNSLIGVTSLKSNTVSLIDPSFREQTAIQVGNQPMDMTFRGRRVVCCLPGRRVGARHRHSVPPRQDEPPGRYGM
jgi:YVTN family beta-propeller protein